MDLADIFLTIVLWLHVLAAPEELVRKVPPTVMLSAEFDMMRWQLDEYAAKLHQCGVLADVVLIPGGIHSDCIMPMGKYGEIQRRAFQLYG